MHRVLFVVALLVIGSVFAAASEGPGRGEAHRVRTDLGTLSGDSARTRVSTAVTAVGTREVPVSGNVAYTRTWRVPNVGDLTWITVADLEGSGRLEITQRPPRSASWGDTAPRWSPGGSRLAFIREGKTGSGLYVVNRDGTGLRRVLPLPNARFPVGYDGSDYAWSANGRRLAFAYGPLWVVNGDGTGSRRLLAARACKPSWSRDGESLVYLGDESCETHRGSNEWVPGFRALYRIDVDGSHRRQLATGSFGDVSWSPDGNLIALTTDCEVGHGGDWACSASLMRADGSGRHRLVERTWGGGDWGVEWAANGRELLWSSYPTFKATNVATGRTHAVLPRPYGEGFPVGLSRDGRRVAVYAAAGYDAATTHAVPPIIVVTVGGRLLRHVTAPRGWHSADVSVQLR